MVAPNEMYPASEVPLAAANEAESNISDNFDFSNLFEEEAEDALSSAPFGEKASWDLSNCCVEAPAPATNLNQFQAQTQQKANQLVNMVFIVDPTTQQIIFPHHQQQVLQQQLQAKMSATPTPSLTDNQPRTVSPSSVTEPRFSLCSNNSSFPLPMPNLSFLNNSNRNNNVSNCTLVTNEKVGTNISATSTALYQALKMQIQQDLTIKVAAQQAVSDANTTFISTEPTAAAAAPPQAPIRALSAYNYFFCSERDHILNGTEPDYSVSKQDRLLQAHWGRDRTKKRRHRKTHGKIDFTTLSKRISSSWKALSEEHKKFYREVAARDWERYQDELARYKEGMSSCIVPTTNKNQQQP